MTDEEKQAAEAYIKLHDDVRQFIVGTVLNELMTPSSAMYTQIQINTLNGYPFKDAVKNVIKEQMNKY